jgi:membrane fusion protein (multidrug efflux system)
VLHIDIESTDDAQVAADIVPVAARVAGQVRQVLVQENQLVRRGDLLVLIDDTELAARVRRAQAELATAQAQAEVAQAQVRVIEATARGARQSAGASYAAATIGVNTAEAEIAAARAAVERIEIEARRTAADLERVRELRRLGMAAAETLDHSQATHDGTLAHLAQARAQLALAMEARHAAAARVLETKGRMVQSEPVEAQVSAAQAAAALARAHVESAAAALELARIERAYAEIRAPIDGHACDLEVHEGQLVNVGQPIVQVVPTSTYVLAHFKETQIGRMRPGQRAFGSIDAFPGRRLIGRVESVAGATGATFSVLPADNATGNFIKVVQRVPVRIVWTELPQDLALRAGLSAEVSVEVGR